MNETHNNRFTNKARMLLVCLAIAIIVVCIIACLYIKSMNDVAMNAEYEDDTNELYEYDDGNLVLQENHPTASAEPPVHEREVDVNNEDWKESVDEDVAYLNPDIDVYEAFDIFINNIRSGKFNEMAKHVDFDPEPLYDENSIYGYEYAYKDVDGDSQPELLVKVSYEQDDGYLSEFSKDNWESGGCGILVYKWMGDKIVRITDVFVWPSDVSYFLYYEYADGSPGLLEASFDYYIEDFVWEDVMLIHELNYDGKEIIQETVYNNTGGQQTPDSMPSVRPMHWTNIFD